MPSTIDDFSDSDLGAPLTYAQCELIPGSDAPMSLPVFSMPSSFSARPDQTSIQTLLALGTSSHPDGGSSAIAPPMDMEDSPLLETGLPGCPFRFTRTADGRSRMEIRPLAYSFITHGSWSLSVHRGRLTSYATPQRSGLISLDENKRWLLPSTCNGMRALCCPIFRYCRSLQCH